MLALHQAIEDMDIDTARSLLNLGEDVNVRDPEVGMATPLHLAVDIECEDACRRYDNGDVNASPIPVMTKLLLQFDADPSIPDAKGKTAFDWATERNHLEAIILLSR